MPPASVRAVSQMAMQAALPYYQALVQLAEQTTDPIAYSLAHDACHRIRGADRPTACAAISTARWAELEPDNGVPWLQIAAEARQRGDESATRDALARAAGAQRFDNHATDLMRPLVTPAARGAALLERSNLQAQVMGPVGGLIVPGGYHDGMLFCRAGEEPARKALCDQLATQLVEKDTTLLGRAIGRAIGARAGWPAERVAALKDEHDAMMWMQMRDSPDPRAMLSCDGLAAAERRLLDVMRRGEVGSLRQEMIRTGHTPAALAREYREHQARARESAAQQK